MQRKDFILTSDLLSTTVKIDICLQMGWYILLNLISCRFLNFRQIKCISLTKCEVQWCQPCRSFLEGISVLILLWAKLPHVYIYIYTQCFTKTAEFSVYERQIAAYKLICERQEDSGLQLWTAGSAQLQLDVYFFLNSSSHNIPHSTAKPQKLFSRPCPACSPLANTLPEPSTTLQWGGPQKEPAPAATAEARPETQAKKFYQASLQVTQIGKRKTALPYPRGKMGQWPKVEAKARRLSY